MNALDVPADETQSCVEALAASVITACRKPLPGTAASAARAAFVDWFCVGMAGANGIMSGALRASVAAPGATSRLFGGGRASDSGAALVNGTAAHTVELDDIYAPGLFHPGAPVISAAFAVAESIQASGAELLRAIVMGYEVGNRVAVDLGPKHYAQFHTTGTAGALGAAAAAAALLELAEGEIADALSISATMAAGLQQTFRTSAVAKPLHAGHAGQTGVIAAQAARHGGSGARNVLDGPLGLGAVMSDSPSWATSRAGFGPRFLIEDTTTKAYPCCGHTFAAIDAARELVETGLTVEDVADVAIDSYVAATEVAGILQPHTVEEAKFSLAFTVATTLRSGNVSLDSFTPARVADPDTAALAARVHLRATDEFTRASPARRGARVSLTFRDGTKVSSIVSDRYGSPENPVPADQMEQKFARLLGDRADILPQLWAIGEMSDVRDLAF